jgi:tripartite-type tricarboxylate transporter receptor subunit TctC
MIRSKSLHSASCLLLAATTACALMSAAPLQAQEAYPNRPLRIIVAFPPGGGADLTARLVAQKMSESMRQPVVVENKPGANGMLGAEAVMKAAPDGTTMLLIDRGALGINPSLYARLPYDPRKDFSYVGIATEAPYVMVTHPTLGAKSVGELVAATKAKPGSVRYGSFGVGSLPQLNLEALNQRTGIDLQHVPYKGAAAAVQAVVAGEVEVALASAPSILGFVRDGRLRALAVGADRRMALLPEVPTLAEAGITGEVLHPTWFAFATPAGTPPAIVTRLNAEMKRALAAPDVTEKLLANGLVPVGGSPDAMARTVATDIARFAALAQSIGLKAE